MNVISIWGLILMAYYGAALTYLAGGDDIPFWTWPVLLAFVLTGALVVLSALYCVAMFILTILGA